MVEPSKGSYCSELGSGNLQNDMRDCDKQQPFATTNTASPDLQNERRKSAPTAIQEPLRSKDGISFVDATKVESGVKRPPTHSPVSPSVEQSPTANAAHGRLVYVRRKVEVDMGKNSTCDSTYAGVDSQVRTQIKEPNVSSFPIRAPLPKALTSSCTKPSLTLSLGVSDAELTPRGSNYDRLDWEERYHQLQMLLKKLNESDHKDYVQMLRSLSSVELSRHAVELEKRSIQLSLEEAKEMQRVSALNVLGRSVNNFKSPSTYKD